MEMSSKFARFVHPLSEPFVEEAWAQELFEIRCAPYGKSDASEERVNRLIDASVSLGQCVHARDTLPQFASEFWARLKEQNLGQRNLLPYLSYFVSSYSKNSNHSKADIVGLITASIYLKLLSVPGAVVFDLFHQVVFDYAVDKLNMASNMQQEKRSGKSNLIAQGWNRSVLKKVDELLDDLTRLIRMGFLRDRPLAVKVTIKNLTGLLTIDKSIIINDFEEDNNKTLSMRVYKALFILCNEKDNIPLVLEGLLSILALTDTPTQARCQFETVSNFLQYLLKKRRPKEAWQPTMVFMQQLLTRFVDRTENRQRMSQLASCLVQKMPLQLCNCVLRWTFLYLAFSERSTHRLMALEFFLQMLHVREMEDCREEDLILPDEPSEDDADDEDELELDDKELEELVIFPFKGGKTSVTHYHIFCMVLFKIDDVAPMVRIKALNILADILVMSDNKQLKQIVQTVFVAHFSSPEINESETSTPSYLWPNRKEFLKAVFTAEFSLPDTQKILNLLLASTEDERVYVRKSALQALVNLGKLSHNFISTSFLKVLASHCRDPAVMIRKQVLGNMTDLLKAHFEKFNELVDFWVLSVVPCLQDPENKIQELVQEYVHEVFFGNLVEFSNGLTGSHLLPWKILRLVTTHNLKKLFSETFQFWTKQKHLPANLAKTVRSYIDTSFNKEAWILLAIISEGQNIKDVDFAFLYFKRKDVKLKKAEIQVVYLVLRVLLLNNKSLSKDQLKDLQSLLVAKIEHFMLPTDLISIAMDVVSAIDITSNKTEAFESWCKTLYKSLEVKISQYISRPNVKAPEKLEELILREMTTFGDSVRLASISNYSPKSITPMTSITVSGDNITSFAAKKLAFEVTPRMKAVAVIALGKIALLQEQVALEVVKIFQHSLKTSKDNVLKCNMLTALADLVGKYAAMVDSIVSDLETSLRDPNVEMRRHALVVVVQLLQGDYVKLRGTTLLFYLLSTLCDPEEDLRDMTACYLTNTLITKEPNILQQNLISSLVLFNCYKDHEQFSKTPISAARLKMISMSGPDNKKKRLAVYNFMLEYMSDSHRFDSLHRICTQILGGFVDKVFSFNDDCILEDALAILSSENIRLRCMKVATDGDVTDADEAFAKLYNQTKKIFIAQEVKNKIIENVVPIIKSLKTILRRERSRLQDDLMQFLRNFMRDFKTEVEEIFSGDKQLVEEIMFDIRQMEEQENGPEEPGSDDD